LLRVEQLRLLIPEGHALTKKKVSSGRGISKLLNIRYIVRCTEKIHEAFYRNDAKHGNAKAMRNIERSK